eukprot:SAG31_NODE_12210_length_958_cov_2.187427_1_plen_23_part_10
MIQPANALAHIYMLQMVGTFEYI